MEIIAKLPDRKGIIGTREIEKAVKAGKVKYVIAADNCPDSLLKKIENVKIDKFEGNESQLGTKLGKPFPVAMVGYE